MHAHKHTQHPYMHILSHLYIHTYVYIYMHNCFGNTRCKRHFYLVCKSVKNTIFILLRITRSSRKVSDFKCILALKFFDFTIEIMKFWRNLIQFVFFNIYFLYYSVLSSKSKELDFVRSVCITAICYRDSIWTIASEIASLLKQ